MSFAMYLDLVKTSLAAAFCSRLSASLPSSMEYWFNNRRKFLSSLSAPIDLLLTAARRHDFISSSSKRRLTNSSAARFAISLSSRVTEEWEFKSVDPTDRIDSTSDISAEEFE